MGKRDSRTLNLLLIVALVLVLAASLVTWGPGPRRPWTTYPTVDGPPPGTATPGQSGAVSPCGWAWAPRPGVWVDLPARATRMWICDGVVRKPVTTGISAVIDQINALPKLDRLQRDCGPLADSGVVFVDSPNGTRAGFSWDTSCSGGGVAGRSGAAVAANAVRTAYQAQYGDGAPEDPDDDPNPCRPRQFTRIESPPEALQSLTMCRGSLDAANGALQTAPARLAPGDVVRVVAGLQPHDRHEDPSVRPPGDAVLLRGVYPQGLAPATATLWWSGDLLWTGHDRYRVWDLTPQGRAVLDRYRRGYVPDDDRLGPSSLAGDSPCATSLELQYELTLPDAPNAVWLCTDTKFGVPVPPVPDPLLLDPQALVDVFHGLNQLGENETISCPTEQGRTYTMVFRYRDRDVVIGGSLWGCGSVGARFGAGNLLNAYTTLLSRQRLITVPPAVPSPTPGGATAEQASPCEGWGRWMPGRVDRLSWLVSCDQDAVTAVLPSSLIVDLRSHSQLANARYDPLPASITLAALAPDGTQIRIEWDGTDGWYEVNGQWYRWRPSEAAKQALP